MYDGDWPVVENVADVFEERSVWLMLFWRQGVYVDEHKLLPHNRVHQLYEVKQRLYNQAQVQLPFK